MTSYRRYKNRQALSWAGGTVAVPTSQLPHEVESLNVVPFIWNDGPNVVLVGQDQMYPGKPAGGNSAVNFRIKLFGSDTTDVPPVTGALLRSSGFSEVVQGATPNIGYKYAMADPHPLTGTPAGYTDSIQFLHYNDRLKSVLNTCVGNFTLNFEAGQIPYFDFGFIGTVEDDALQGYDEGTPGTFTQGAKPSQWGDSDFACTITRAAGPVTGTVTGAESTTVLIDSAADFYAAGIYAGDTVTMVVGLETATIVTVDSKTQLTSTALSGAGKYTTPEAYTITRDTTYQPTLVVPRLSFTPGNQLAPRPNSDGIKGYSTPLITGRNPRLALTIEADRLDILNVEYEYLNQTTWLLQWSHENGGGNRHELTCKMSCKINSFPQLTDIGAGRMGYVLDMYQSIDTGDTPFELAWQGT